MKINNIFKNKIKGFTLLELIVVIAIIAILATIALPSFTTALKKARDGRKIADMRTIQSQIASIMSSSGTGSYYPDSLPTSSVAFNTTGNVSSPLSTSTLTALFKTQTQVTPSSVVNGQIGYAAYGCGKTPAPSTLTTPSSTAITYNGECTGYVLFTQLEDLSNSILTTNGGSSLTNVFATAPTATNN